MIVKTVDYNYAIELTSKLKDLFGNLSKKYNLNEIAHIGATPFNQVGTIPEMVHAANEAYEKDQTNWSK